MIRNVTARLVATPGADHPYKVVVASLGVLVAEVNVSSEIAGAAIIKRIRGGRRLAVLRLS